MAKKSSSSAPPQAYGPDLFAKREKRRCRFQLLDKTTNRQREVGDELYSTYREQRWRAGDDSPPWVCAHGGLSSPARQES